MSDNLEYIATQLDIEPIANALGFEVTAIDVEPFSADYSAMKLESNGWNVILSSKGLPIVEDQDEKLKSLSKNGNIYHQVIISNVGHVSCSEYHKGHMSWSVCSSGINEFDYVVTGSIPKIFHSMILQDDTFEEENNYASGNDDEPFQVSMEDVIQKLFAHFTGFDYHELDKYQRARKVIETPPPGLFSSLFGKKRRRST